MPDTNEVVDAKLANALFEVGNYISWPNEGTWDDDEESDWIERVRFNSMQGIQYITEGGEVVNESDILNPPMRKFPKRNRLE